MCRCNYCNLKLLGVQVSSKSAACDCSNSALVLNFIRLMEVSRQLLEVRIFFFFYFLFFLPDIYFVMKVSGLIRSNTAEYKFILIVVFFRHCI